MKKIAILSICLLLNLDINSEVVYGCEQACHDYGISTSDCKSKCKQNASCSCTASQTKIAVNATDESGNQALYCICK